MKNMNGDESTKLITELNQQGYQKSVIIGHSTDDDHEITQAFKKAGSEFFEPKPPSYDNLKQIIEDYANKKKEKISTIIRC